MLMVKKFTSDRGMSMWDITKVTEFWSGFHCHYLLRFRFESEKWVNFEIIVGIPSVLKAIILGIQDILEDFLEIIEMPKRKSIVLHNYVTSSSFLLYFVVRYPITLLILAYQLPLNLIAVSHRTFCQLILSYMIIEEWVNFEIIVGIPFLIRQ